MLFEYVAVDKTGAKIEGEEDGENERNLAAKLRAKNLLLIESWAKDSKQKKSFEIQSILWRLGRVSLVEKINFARNLAVMIGAGLSLIRSLDAMAEQTNNLKFKKIIVDIIENVNKGKNFSESMMPHNKIFGDIFINMIASGEVSGKLEKTLILLSRQMKRDYDLRSRVRSAMIYPAIIVMVLLAIGILMLVYVVPTLTSTFAELEIQLPITTRILIASSSFLLTYYLYVVIGFAGFIALFVRIIKTKSGKEIFDKIIIKIPVFGPLIQKFNIARMARTFGSLIISGVSITKALEITSSVLGNVLFRQAIAQASEDIQKGKPLNETLKKFPKLFPPMFTQTISVGEETGTISRMLFRLAIFYEEDVTTTTKNLSTIVEPMLMIFIGGVVGLFAVSIIQPIYGGLGGL